MEEEKVYFRSDTIAVTHARIRISSADSKQSKLGKLLSGSHNVESIIDIRNVDSVSTFTPPKLGPVITIVIGVLLLIGVDLIAGLLTIIGGGVWYWSRIEFVVRIKERQGYTQETPSGSTIHSYDLVSHDCYAYSEAEQQKIVKAVRDAQLGR